MKIFQGIFYIGNFKKRFKMVIGLTYDLRDEYLKMGYGEEETGEFDRIDTIESIENALHSLGYETDRIGHIKNLVNRLSNGDRWDLVFNIAEGMYGSGREAQVPALLDAYQIPYVFSGPLVLSVTLDKAWTKEIVRNAGIPTPDYYLVHRTEDIGKIELPFPLFAKPLAEGTGKGINANSVIKDKAHLDKLCRHLLKTFKQPVIVEHFLSGREFTAGIVGTGDEAKCVGVMEIVLKENAEENVYSYINKEECEERIIYTRTDPAAIEACSSLALKVWKAIRAEDGGRVDIRFDENGVANFLEVNPLAGIHPEHSDLPILSKLNGISYLELMKMIMDSATKKVRRTVYEKSTDSHQ
jgi:D-alanine-D-alanine ligase